MKAKKLFTLLLGGTFILGSILGMTACKDRPEDKPATTACEHTLSYITRLEPTCVNSGMRAHYECGKCNKIFFDDAGKIELSEENITLPRLSHSLTHSAARETEENEVFVPEYWHCFACNKYFTDAAATAETTYRALYKDAYEPIKLADGIGSSLDIFDGSSDISPLYDDFTFRYFMTWTNSEGKGLEDFPVSGQVQVNINLNREGAGDRVDWYNFGIGYNKSYGLYYKPFESGDNRVASAEFTQLFLKQGGIYVVVVREGGTASFYLEDEQGNRHIMSSGVKFGASEAVVRLAANQAVGVDGWTPSVSKTAICIGTADHRCIFDKAYENNAE